MTNISQPQYVLATPQKSVGIAYLLWATLGLIGGHHFYLGKVGKGLLWLCTLGLLGVGWVIDAFTLGAQTKRVNDQIRAGQRTA